MLKKILFGFIIFALLFIQNSVFADEIIDETGASTQCHIITVSDGLIEYVQNGVRYTVRRAGNSAVFQDYVDVRQNLLIRRDEQATRYVGQVIFKDTYFHATIRANGQDTEFPWYRVKNIGLYIPKSENSSL